MNIFTPVLQILKKYAKGMFALFVLNLIALISIYIFNSCQNNIDETNDATASRSFLSALDTNKSWFYIF